MGIFKKCKNCDFDLLQSKLREAERHVKEVKYLFESDKTLLDKETFALIIAKGLLINSNIFFYFDRKPTVQDFEAFLKIAEFAMQYLPEKSIISELKPEAPPQTSE